MPELQFRDAATFNHWKSGLPITNVLYAHQLVSEQVAALGGSNVGALERLKILDALKETAFFVQTEAAKRYLGKPLPLDVNEARVWDQIAGLWCALAANYKLCLDAYLSGEASVAPHAALITMRCLRMQAMFLFEHYQVYREPDGAAWKAFHGFFALAEEHGLTRTRVQDVFAKREADMSCAEVYVQGLLAELANPYALSIRQLLLLRRWLDKWAPLAGLSAQPLPAGQIPALAVDFSSESAPGLAAQVASVASTRYLDLEQLSKSLRQTINMLKQGHTPGQLGLGDDARQPGCENLIMLLYLQWCRAGTLRTEERSPAAETAEVCFGVSSSFELLGGDNRSQQDIEFSARRKWEIDNLGFSMRPSNAARHVAIKKSELWEVVNKSASGFMCMLREASGAMRMMHNQLLGVRLAPAVTRVGTLQWMRFDAKGECFCGVRLFPGAPRPLKVRQANLNPGLRQPLEPAVLIPESVMPKTPMTLLLPVGWFQSGRLIETEAESSRLVKLISLIERGADFDRCAIMPAPDSQI